jgi:2-oxoglutarate dehydrogenase complex dehydrogenase (E1) component-like enzyme
LGNWGNSGDVKYHLGAYARIDFPNKKLIMLPNPSHLGVQVDNKNNEVS